VADIREVARSSGVSTATVSRVLNGSTRVSEDTRRRVLEHAQALDYVPSAAARALVRRRSQLIGVVLDTGGGHPDLQHPFFQEVLVGLKEVLGALDYDLLLFTSAEHAYAQRALRHRVDGVVLMSADTSDPETARMLATLPAVAVDTDVSGPRVAFVTSDNMRGASLAVRHLHELGHRRIATITGPRSHAASRERLRGFRAELRERRTPARREYVVAGDFYTESGSAAMHRLLRLREPPTAVFAASDLMAVGAIQAIRDAGLRVPHDVAVVGFDDAQAARLVEPPLTTVRQDKRGLGRAAAEKLVALVEDGGDTTPVVLPVDLVVRRSSVG
jgi:LacI family transcriptional regulator